MGLINLCYLTVLNILMESINLPKITFTVALLLVLNK